MEEARLKVASTSYRWRGHIQYSSLPESIKHEGDIMKSWLQKKFPV